MPAQTEPTTQPAEATFVCDCRDWGRSACKGEPFFKEYEGKRYCVLHYPDTDKLEAFRVALKRKLEEQDFDFRSVWFPEDANFFKVEFSGEADFRNATFSAKAEFPLTTFSANAEFTGATFSADANFFRAAFSANAGFNQATFSADAEFTGATFSAGATFYSATFSANAEFTGATFSADANFFRAAFSANAGFNQATFSADAEFTGATFSAGATFYSATFSADAEFTGATFSASANFYSATFSAGAGFNQATFSAYAEFTSATFSAGANFASTTFSAGATFYSATFSANVTFYSATFSAYAGFNQATFSASANFASTTFSAEAGFNGATFSAEADFKGATFSADANFTSATFKSYVSFAGTNKKKVFGEHPRLDFQYTHIEKPERISFHTLSLKPHWFINCDCRKFEFIDCQWNYDLREELEGASKAEIDAPHRLLAVTYRQLADNAEANHRYHEASRFRYNAFEARRIERFRGFVPWRLDWWYWLASGYGERVGRAFLVFVALFALFAFGYGRSGFEQSGKGNAANVTQGAAIQPDTVGKPLRWKEAFVYSFNVSILQKPEPKPLTLAAKILVSLETVLGPAQAALLALAVRRRFMR